MYRKYPHLSSPIQVGNVFFRNKMFGAPMGGTDITKDCTIGPRTIAFYENRAKGGAATVTVSELVVHPKTEGSHMFHLDLETVDSLASFTYTADAIKRHGAVASIELSHSGQYAGTYLVDKDKKQTLSQWGVSQDVRADGVEIKELTKELIKEIIEAYGEKAKLAKKAGFDMVMVHAGHGWLINQFLSPYFNKRTDEYGGSLDNRLRFLNQVLDSIREAVGEGFPIELRISGSELFDGGYDLNDGIEIAKRIEDKIDILHVSAGTYQRGFAVTHPSMFLPHGPNVYLAAEIKKHVSVKVATVGGLNDPEKMEEIISSGQADIVEMARALLADHELPKKVMQNRDDEIIHCLRCFTCMAERAETGTRKCTVNPIIGREIDGLDMPLARNLKKVLIVGGGPSGLKAAITAKRRGHDVTLCEMSNEVGGILKGEQVISFKYEMYRLGVTLGDIARKEGVKILLNTKVDKKYAEKFGADVIIVAVGSEALVPNIKGIDGSNVTLVTELHNEISNIKENVIVLGGGLSGAEAAVFLAKKNKNVTLVEMRDALAVDCNIRHRPILLNEIEKNNINVLTRHKCTEIKDDVVICTNINDEIVSIPVDTVIVALGQKSRRDVAIDLLDCALEVKIIGDAISPSTIGIAIYQGYHVAYDI